MKRLPLILLVWLGCAFAWMVLGVSLVERTGSRQGAIGREVRLLWGPELRQVHPSASWERVRLVERTVPASAAGPGTTVRTEVRDTFPAPLAASAVEASLDLVHRRKGLLWFPTYTVGFRGRYAFVNPDSEPREVRFTFPLGAETTVYDGFAVSGPGGEPVASAIEKDRATWSATLAPGERREYTVRYRSRGTSSWTYGVTDGATRVDDFALELTTNFRGVDFAPGSLSPTRHETTLGGWRGTWRFESLVASAPIGLVLPERLNPGPIASRITFFAPVGLLFFFFVVAIVTTARGVSIHPLNYFFFGTGFFAFHLLFAYLVDHLAIVPSFGLAAAVSVFLVVSYARLFTGWKFALRVIGAAQCVYLVLFSATFFWQGFTGLAITVGAIVTLFLMMQFTGRTDWSRAGAPRLAGASPEV